METLDTGEIIFDITQTNDTIEILLHRVLRGIQDRIGRNGLQSLSAGPEDTLTIVIGIGSQQEGVGRLVLDREGLVDLNRLAVHGDDEADRRFVQGLGEIAMQRTAGHGLIRTYRVFLIQREAPFVFQLVVVGIIDLRLESIVIINDESGVRSHKGRHGVIDRDLVGRRP